MGPDGKVYGIVRENHEYYIKVADNKKNLVTEDFSYIGGLQNKKQKAYPSYSKAIKQLNLKFNSLNEAYGKLGQINVFEDDNLLNEMGYGFTGEGNLEGHDVSECCGAQTMEGMCMECGGAAYGMNEELSAEMNAVENMKEAELSDKQKEIAKLDGDPNEIDALDLKALRAKKKGKLSIETAISEMDNIIESIVGTSKKKVYTIK
jgi:hypothetical protein